MPGLIKLMRVFLFILIYIIISTPIAYAAQTRGTDPLIDGSIVAFSLEYDYIFHRDIKSSSLNKGEIKEQNTLYGKLTFKLSKNIYAYIKGGGVKYDAKLKLSDGSTLDEKYKPGFYTGCGIKLCYEFLPKVTACLDNQLDWLRNDIDDAVCSKALVTSKSGHTSTWEYQVAGILSYRIDYKTLMNPSYGELPQFTPYIGVKYAYLEADANVKIKGANFTVGDDTIKNKNKVGLILGVDMTLESIPAFKFNVEGRILDDNAISTALDYNF